MIPARPVEHRRVDAGLLEAGGEQRDGGDGLGRLAERGADLRGGHALREQLARAAVAAALGEHGRDEVARAGQAGERLRPEP